MGHWCAGGAVHFGRPDASPARAEEGGGGFGDVDQLVRVVHRRRRDGYHGERETDRQAGRDRVCKYIYILLC